MIKEEFRRYLEEAIGSEKALVAFSAFDTPAFSSVRMNPYKKGRRPEGAEVPWNPHGVILDERPQFTLDPHFHAGAYYVQDSSSMFVGFIFRECLRRLERGGTPLRVLDLCAAPGGKSTDIATSLRETCGEDFLLVSNEVMKQRASVLADNMAIWGDPNVVVTSDDPSAFGKIPEFFDVIVADVPCSGEGMFRKDLQAQQQWSEDNVALCEARQRRIIADVWPSLKKGGIMIYSTCTFNRRENDGNVEWIAGELGADMLTKEGQISDGVIKTECGYSLVPGHVPGEGQYCAALVKTSDEICADMTLRRKKERQRTVQKPSASVPQDLKKMLSADVTLRMKGDTVTAVPTGLYPLVQILEDNLHVLTAGCALGVMKGNTLVPDADLALSLMLRQDAFPEVEVDRPTALSFLHKDAIVLAEAPRGYVKICHEGISLGFVKNLGNRCNNLHPQSRRIRMDIRI